MLKKSSLVITRNHFSKNTTAINIIILAKRSDEGCYSDFSFQEDAERIGNFSLFVLQQPKKLIYISTLPVLGFYIVGALLAIILGHLTFRSAWLIVHCTFCINLVLLDLNRTVDTLPAENFLNYLQFFSIIYIQQTHLTCLSVSNKRLNGWTDQAQICCGNLHEPKESDWTDVIAKFSLEKNLGIDYFWKLQVNLNRIQKQCKMSIWKGMVKS